MLTLPAQHQQQQVQQTVDTSPIVKQLTMAINDELLAFYQYWTAEYYIEGPGYLDILPELKEHAKDEWEHVELLTKRLQMLGGVPTADVADIRANAKPWTPITTSDPESILRQVIEAEAQAVDGYTKRASLTRLSDPVTHKLFVDILAKEQEHLHDLTRILKSF